MQNYSILGNHFSPLLAALAPVFLIWSNVRALFLIQTVGLAAAGLILQQIVRRKYPDLAPLFLLAFYMNAALHDVALIEFRRVTLAVPFLAMALYALHLRKRWPMLIGLLLALLCKESIGLIVCMVGVYLLVAERDWRWGVPLAVIGLAWTFVMVLWVCPAFRTTRQGPAIYLHSYFGLSGGTHGEILSQLLQTPLSLLRRIVDREVLGALWRVFLPLGLVLPFLSPRWAMIALPLMGYMLISIAPSMRRLEGWYMASLLPVFFAAIAVAMTRGSRRRARILIAVLLCGTIAGFVLYSRAPLGGMYEAHHFQRTAHHRLAAQAVSQVPVDARIAAQDPYVPHLSHREHIYLYPWVSIGLENVEYLLLDRHLHPYPLQPHEMSAKIDDHIADTAYTIAWEADGIYLFRRGGDPLPAIAVDATLDGTMWLARADIAVAGGDGVYHPVASAPVDLLPGQDLRVSLYWEALDAPNAERTVSVRVEAPSGVLIAQKDNWPGQGKKPTSWWEAGWQIRDVYYLHIPADAAPGPAQLGVLVYDSYSGETVRADGGAERIEIAPVRIAD